MKKKKILFSNYEELDFKFPFVGKKCVLYSEETDNNIPYPLVIYIGNGKVRDIVTGTIKELKETDKLLPSDYLFETMKKIFDTWPTIRIFEDEHEEDGDYIANMSNKILFDEKLYNVPTRTNTDDENFTIKKIKEK